MPTRVKYSKVVTWMPTFSLNWTILAQGGKEFLAPRMRRLLIDLCKGLGVDFMIIYTYIKCTLWVTTSRNNIRSCSQQSGQDSKFIADTKTTEPRARSFHHATRAESSLSNIADFFMRKMTPRSPWGVTATLKVGLEDKWRELARLEASCSSVFWSPRVNGVDYAGYSCSLQALYIARVDGLVQSTTSGICHWMSKSVHIATAFTEDLGQTGDRSSEFSPFSFDFWSSLQAPVLINILIFNGWPRCQNS